MVEMITGVDGKPEARNRGKQLLFHCPSAARITGLPGHAGGRDRGGAAGSMVRNRYRQVRQSGRLTRSPELIADKWLERGVYAKSLQVVSDATIRPAARGWL